MKKLLRIFLIVLLLLCVDAAAKSKRHPKKEPPRPPKQVRRQDLKVQPRKMDSDRDLRRNVKRFRGDVWISGIPMYNQGSRPECAIAVVRRLLDYYASRHQVHMNSLRQALGYDGRTGTNFYFMVEAIQKYSPQLRLRFQQIYRYMATTQEIKDELKQYNRYITRKNQAIDIPQGIRAVDGFRPFIKEIDFEVWKEMRCTEQRRDQQNAWNQIVRQIDQGIPVVWGVYTGMVREQGALASRAGEHLRLIIGYNVASQCIIYSDSWGPGHEKKEMPWNTAWAITWELFVLDPRN